MYEANEIRCSFNCHLILKSAAGDLAPYCGELAVLTECKVGRPIYSLENIEAAESMCLYDASVGPESQLLLMHDKRAATSET